MLLKDRLSLVGVDDDEEDLLEWTSRTWHVSLIFANWPPIGASTANLLDVDMDKAGGANIVCFGFRRKLACAGLQFWYEGIFRTTDTSTLSAELNRRASDYLFHVGARAMAKTVAQGIRVLAFVSNQLFKPNSHGITDVSCGTL